MLMMGSSPLAPSRATVALYADHDFAHAAPPGGGRLRRPRPAAHRGKGPLSGKAPRRGPSATGETACPLSVGPTGEEVSRSNPRGHTVMLFASLSDRANGPPAAGDEYDGERVIAGIVLGSLSGLLFWAGMA